MKATAIAEKNPLRAINHLQPELGLEFTATPTSSNVVFSYTLGDAIKDARLALDNLKNGGDCNRWLY